jgi:hypothetical protein
MESKRKRLAFWVTSSTRYQSSYDLVTRAQVETVATPTAANTQARKSFTAGGEK